MTKADRALAIIFAIRDLVNDGKIITFTEDWGRDSLTVDINGEHHHTYAGNRTQDEMLTNLLDILHNEREDLQLEEA